MTCDETTPLLMDRLQADISADDEQRLAAHLATCAACRDEAAATAETWTRLGSLGVEKVPSERLRARFHAALAVYEATQARGSPSWLERWWPRQPALQAAFAASLALVGLWVGQQLPSPVETEVEALRSEVRNMGLALLDHQSASERLLGVESARRVAGPEVVNALLERVGYDSNLSVRLAAVDALRAELDRPGVAAGLALALERQESPMLQVALTDALLAAGGDPAIEAVRAMLGRDELDPVVREYLRMALEETGADATPPNTGI